LISRKSSTATRRPVSPVFVATSMRYWTPAVSAALPTRTQASFLSLWLMVVRNICTPSESRVSV
jgi:hypothetical protein